MSDTTASIVTKTNAPRPVIQITDAAITVDAAKCIADKGCRVCIDVCPMDILSIDESTGKAYMKHDECWYCLPCQKDCPTGAITVAIPYLVR